MTMTDETMTETETTPETETETTPETEAAKKQRAPYRRYPRDTIISRVLVDENPKRKAAADRFSLYVPGMTIEDYVKAGGKTHDVYYDYDSKFIDLTFPEPTNLESAPDNAVNLESAPSAA